MNGLKIARGLGALAAVALAGCHSLDVVNPNAPSSNILTDPGVLAAVAGGTMRTWLNDYNTLEIAGVLDNNARSLSSSWNNGNMNTYQHIDISPSDTVTSGDKWTRPNGWFNDLASPQRTSVEHWWYGYYATISAANDALRAIRVDKVTLGSATATAAAEAVAQLIQGASFMMIANDYDQGYFLDETTTGDQLASLVRVNRKVLRDSAEAKLKKAAAVDPNPALPYYNLCALAFNAAKYDEAASACEKSLAADPNKADAWFFKGVSQKKLNNPAANDALNKYLQLDPTGIHSAEAKKLLGQ